MSGKRCHYCCRTDEELRPYGPGGSMVCFDCATSPEHEGETKANYNALLDAAAAISDVITIGTEEGPQPL